MINISQDFAPPYKMIIPYFVFGVAFYLISSIFLFTIDIQNININDLNIISFVHLFLLGFVMMIIFGAMAQMIPVTLEVGHFSVEFYYLIYPLLLIGTLLMVIGFLFNSSILPYGGLLVFLSMLIYLIEAFLTIKKVEKFTNIIKSIVVSNLFLLIGIIIGILMTFVYTGQLSLNINKLTNAHAFALVFGYIMITIMALSLILLPMFGLSHNFSQKPLNNAVTLMSISVLIIIISSIFNISIIDKFAYIILSVSLVIYMYQIVLIYKSRARKEVDIYYKSLFFAFFCFIVSIIFGFLYIFAKIPNLLYASAWLFISGFFAYLIIAHLYKIVPFLVWFEKFSPLVGIQKVPMLTDMVNKKSSNFQFIFGVVGILISTFGILQSHNEIFQIGVSFIVISSIFLLKNILNIIRFQ